MKISEMTSVSALQGSELIEIVQDGVSHKATLNDLWNASPNAAGVYPDVPLNRVTIKRFSGQTATNITLSDNVGLVDMIKKTAYPVLLDRNSKIAAYLNGSDITKTVDGLPATLNDWTIQVMTRVGGFYTKYEYDATNNIKIFKYSPFKVSGYRYVRRRFLNCYGGTVVTNGSTQYLVSNSGQWTTQNYNIQQYHAFAKNLGSSYREIALQDTEVYRIYFWLMHLTFNSQSVYNGVVGIDWNKWWNTANSASGASNCGQFFQTGVTNAIAGHEGQQSQTYTYGDNTTVQISPYKFLWREGMMSGPYWIWNTGYIKKNGIWYKPNDLANIAFDVTNNYTELCADCPNSGWQLEEYEDTMIPTQVGGSDTTGHSDYYWRNGTDTKDDVYASLCVGGANYGSYVGLSCLNSGSGVSYANANFGGALASDDPTDPTPDGTVAS
jgi:hypothetical protein